MFLFDLFGAAGVIAKYALALGLVLHFLFKKKEAARISFIVAYIALIIALIGVGVFIYAMGK